METNVTRAEVRPDWDPAFGPDLRDKALEDREVRAAVLKNRPGEGILAISLDVGDELGELFLNIQFEALPGDYDGCQKGQNRVLVQGSEWLREVLELISAERATWDVALLTNPCPGATVSIPVNVARLALLGRPGGSSGTQAHGAAVATNRESVSGAGGPPGDTLSACLRTVWGSLVSGQEADEDEYADFVDSFVTYVALPEAEAADQMPEFHARVVAHRDLAELARQLRAERDRWVREFKTAVETGGGGAATGAVLLAREKGEWRAVPSSGSSGRKAQPRDAFRSDRWTFTVTGIATPTVALGPADPPPPIEFALATDDSPAVTVRLTPARGTGPWRLDVQLAPDSTAVGVSVGLGDANRPMSGWHGITIDRGTAFSLAEVELPARWLHLEWLTGANELRTDKVRLPFTGGPT